MKNGCLFAILAMLLSTTAQAVTITALPTDPALAVDTGTGLNGAVWFLNPVTAPVSIASATTIVATSGPEARFHSTTVNYNGSDTSTASSFLNSNSNNDGPSLSSNGSTELRSSVFDFKGYIDIQSSTVNFALAHDDGGSLTIAGTSVLSNDCCGTNTATATFANGPGFYPIEVIFSNQDFQNGSGGANINLFTVDVNGGNVVVPSSQLYVFAPEPSAFILAGLGLIGLLLARRRKV